MRAGATRPAGTPSLAVFGAGNVGCWVGGALAAVTDVTLVGRPAVVDAVAEHGLRLSAVDGPRVEIPAGGVRVATTARAVAGADIVLVTVKSSATAAAAEELAPWLAPHAVVVSLQNGLRNVAALAAALPGHGVVAAMVPYNIVRTGPAEWHRGTSGVLMTDDTEAAGPLRRLLGAAGLGVRPHLDMPAVQHAKLLMNLNNAVNALSGLPLREQLGTRAYRRVLAASQREALAVFRAEGVRPARLTVLPPGLTPAVLGLPDAAFRRLAGATLRVDARARSSMDDDLRAGRRTEVDALQGEVVDLAARHALPAPVNQRLRTLIREAEAAGPRRRRWTGPELLAAVAGPA